MEEGDTTPGVALDGAASLWPLYLSSACRWLLRFEQTLAAAATDDDDDVRTLYDLHEVVIRELNSPRFRAFAQTQLTPSVSSSIAVVHAQAFRQAIRKLLYGRTVANRRAGLPFRADDGPKRYATLITRLAVLFRTDERYLGYALNDDDWQTMTPQGDAR